MLVSPSVGRASEAAVHGAFDKRLEGSHTATTPMLADHVDLVRRQVGQPTGIEAPLATELSDKTAGENRQRCDRRRGHVHHPESGQERWI